MYIFETIFIIIYLFLFFIYSNLGSFLQYAIFRIPYLEITINKLPPLFMDWEMFKICHPIYEDIQIIVETKKNLIDIYYLNDEILKSKIPELNLTINNMPPLIANYSNYHFLNIFLQKKINKIYDNNLKYITIYKVYTSLTAEGNKKQKATLLYQHTYGN